jgi:hypothetical protein
MYLCKIICFVIYTLDRYLSAGLVFLEIFTWDKEGLPYENFNLNNNLIKR